MSAGLRVRLRAPGAGSYRYRTIMTAVLLGAAVLVLSASTWRGEQVPDESSATELSERLIDALTPVEGDTAETRYARLEQHLRWQPSDARARVFKARLDLRAERYEQAAAGFAEALAGRSRAANDAGVWVEYAEARGLAQGGTLAGEPLKLVHKALDIDANHGPALDLAGSGAWELGDFAQAAFYWKQLLAQIPPAQVRHAQLTQAIERAEQRARMSLPPVPAKP